MEQKVQDIFEKVKETATAAAQAAGKMADVAGKKAGEIVNSTKINLQVFDLNTDIDVLFKEIGKSVYLTHTGVAADTSDIESKIAQIDEKYNRIANLKAEMDESKTVIRCPNCGKICDKANAFCSSCGKEL